MVDFLNRDPYTVGREAGNQRRQQQSNAAALRDLQDLERVGAEAKMTNDAALDRNIRSQFSQGSPLRSVGTGRPMTGGASPESAPAAGGAQPTNARRAASSAYLMTPGHAAQGAKMAIDQDTQDVAVFDQTMKYLAAGQPELARTYAERYGDKIPDQILGNVAAQRDIADTWKQFSKVYEGRPKDLKAAMETATKEIIGRHFPRGQGAPANRFAYQGLPEPQVMSKTQRSTQPAAVQTAEWLVEKGVARTPQEAWQILGTAKTSPWARAQVIQRLYNAMAADFTDTRSPQEKWDEAQSMVDQISPTAPQAPQPPQTNGAAPSAQPQQQPQIRRYVPGRGFVQ